MGKYMFCGCDECKIKQLQEDMENLKEAIHYPGCWDTTAYPTFLSALNEIGCNRDNCVLKDKS